MRDLLYALPDVRTPPRGFVESFAAHEELRLDSQLLLDVRPFVPDDVTAGCENEFQVAVAGRVDKVDLPQRILSSNYYKNLLRRVAAGDVPPNRLTALKELLFESKDNVWENSWVAVPRARLNAYAHQVFSHDLSADKRQQGTLRSDVHRFIGRTHDGEEALRIPISYLLNLSLAQAVGAVPDSLGELQEIGESVMKHFLSDNTSPETYSFVPVAVRGRESVGQELARETLRRFLLSQCLLEFANRSFGLIANGQRALMYFSPLTPSRQRKLNDLISDEFYRELFMSPCLAGWDQGEQKHQYMVLCHQVLSRSRLYTLAKLREAGITASRLVVLPGVSNTSLANNGTHVNLGSHVLTELRSADQPEFDAAREKYCGDLVIKIVEHFLPLFVDTFSAAPLRLDFADFHPEIALGFLPHELDFTHLRMLWRRWKKKAAIRVLGQPLTPTGWQRCDEALGRWLGLHGDLVPDFRLLDYLVSPMSTPESPALDGRLGNDLRLRRDLTEQGIFDVRMAHYTLYRLRDFANKGFTGFEGRFYSLFPSVRLHMAPAVNLQALITALAYRLVLSGRVTHDHIPDTPSVESERRQVVFVAAVGNPTFYVRTDSANAFLCQILRSTSGCRTSHRYPKYVRVPLARYRAALIGFLKTQAPDLIEAFNAQSLLGDLEAAFESPDSYGAAARLVRDALGTSLKEALRIPAAEFSEEMERYYRTRLHQQYVDEALDVLLEDLRALEKLCQKDTSLSRQVAALTGGQPLAVYMGPWQKLVRTTTGEADEWQRLIYVLLLIIRAIKGGSL